MSAPQLSGRPVAEGVEPRRSPLLGVVAFLLSLVAYLGLPVIAAALGRDVTLELGLALPIVVFGAVAVLGIIAAVTGRGRGWAVAAIVIAVANPSSPVHTGIVVLLETLFG